MAAYPSNLMKAAVCSRGVGKSFPGGERLLMRNRGVPMSRESVEGELQPGDICAQDGLYEVIHREHRLPHSVIISAGEVFPPCRQCGAAVRFRLIVGSSNEPKRPRAKAARKRTS